MTQDDDKPDLGRFEDRDTTRDEFNTGPTDEQIRRAEEMLGSFNVPTYVEKRDLSEDYHPGSLQPMDRSADPIKVLISRHPVTGEKRHVVLSEEPLPAMREVEISTRRAGQLHTMIGRFEPGHPGRRGEDNQNGTLMVSFLYPVE